MGDRGRRSGRPEVLPARQSQTALAGEITGFTGVDDPYEEPEQPELVLDTDKETVEESATKVIGVLQKLGYI